MFLKRKRIYKVFFSWQSDTKGKERAIIEHALKQAKNEIKNQYGYEIEIDHSTLGEVGMPTIEVALLQKIEKSDIFICDITPVTSYNVERANGIVKNKQVPNANVLIELGYAMSAMGSEYIIPVAHAGSWDVSDLPFDINHKRVYLYSSKDCSLVQPILAIIEYVNEYGKHRVLQSSFTSKIRATIDIVYNKWFSRKNIAKPLASIESTVLFSMRIPRPHGSNFSDNPSI
jgi:hypothetical protein